MKAKEHSALMQLFCICSAWSSGLGTIKITERRSRLSAAWRCDSSDYLFKWCSQTFYNNVSVGTVPINARNLFAGVGFLSPICRSNKPNRFAPGPSIISWRCHGQPVISRCLKKKPNYGLQVSGAPWTEDMAECTRPLVNQIGNKH